MNVSTCLQASVTSLLGFV